MTRGLSKIAISLGFIDELARRAADRRQDILDKHSPAEGFLAPARHAKIHRAQNKLWKEHATVTDKLLGRHPEAHYKDLSRKAREIIREGYKAHAKVLPKVK